MSSGRHAKKTDTFLFLQLPRNFLGLYSSVVYFALDATCLIFPLENQMRNPRHYLGCPGIVNLNYVCLAVLYSFFGAVGYIRYGETVKSSIILNFPPDSM